MINIKLKQNSKMKITNKISLSSKMKQSLRILKMNTLDLRKYIYQQAQENILLKLEEEDIYNKNDFSENFKRNSKKTSVFDIISKSAENKISLKENFLQNLRLNLKDETEILISEYIVGNLNSKGYLKINIENLEDIIKRDTGKNINKTKIDGVRKKIMKLNPKGVGSLDFHEYITEEFKIENGSFQNKIYEILSKNFEEFMKKDFNMLKKRFDLKNSDLKKVYKTIKDIKPFPFHGISQNKAIPIVPELSIKKSGDNYIIDKSEKILPKVSFDRDYYEKLSKDEEALEYLKKKAMDSKGIIFGIQQREITIYRIIKTIIKYQRDFFEEGIKYLMPLNMSQVGQDLNLNKSTISRASNGKYIETPQGIYEISFFFSRKVKTEDGSGISKKAVEYMIIEMIKNENPFHPMTDREISNSLNNIGIKISKRSIGNYREKLNILPTYLRKEIEIK
ncbi:MAG: RNA polymerase factor sigma-54 [Fusobacteriota bacterium]